MSSSVAHSVLYLFYRYHYPFEVFHQAAFPLWSSLLGCWLPRVYGIVCLMDSPLCTCLACHIIRSISVMVTRTGHIRGLPQMYHIWVTTQWRHSYLAHWRFILYLFLSPPQCVTTTAPSSSCFRNIASAFLIISVARQHSGLYKRLHKAQTIQYIKRQKYYHQALCCPLHIVYMTPRHSPPLPADRAYLSIGLASTRGVLVFPPMRVFLDLGTRIVIFSSFLSTFSSTTISRVFPDLSIVFFPSTRLCF